MSETGPSPDDHAARLRDWCLDRGFLARGSQALVEGFVAEAGRCDVPIHRLNLTLRTLHPVLAAVGWIWEDGPGFKENRYRHAGREEESYLRSPVRPLLEGEATVIRVRLEEETVGRFPITADLRARGFTDYLALAIYAGDGSPNVLSLATRDPLGFTGARIHTLSVALPALRAVVDRHTQRLVAESICSTYIGPDTGRRVLDGNVQRGAVERLRAAVWFVDIRDFTARSAELGINGTVALLNEVFGIVGRAVEDEGGEILKFIGDAALVVFPCQGGGDTAACVRALACARRVHQGLADAPETAGVGVGVGLHLGEVAYGNIGAEQRLDFTVIGHAVNVASRLEQLCGRLGETILASQEFQDAIGESLRPVGAFVLKGVPGPVEVYAAGAPAGQETP